ncbi:MAG: hypothetical protein ACRC92_12755 [Peptostreptococcaceae bacterium]
MYYRKCEGKKCPVPKKCHHEHEVAYYEVKKQDNSKKCKCDIEKTEGLIDAVECKAGEVLGDLADASMALVDAGQALAEIPDLAPAAALLNGIAKALKMYAGELECLAKELAKVDNELEHAAAFGEAAAEEIAEAKVKQEELLELTECLERQFDKTVCCLKKEEGGFPILIPIEDDGQCHVHKKCNCDWED